MNKYKKLVNYISENDYPINLDDLIHDVSFRVVKKTDD